MECQNCHVQIEEGALFCPECGVRQSKPEEEPKERNFFCPYCGKPLGENAVFCPGCGEKIDGIGEAEENTAEKGNFAGQPETPGNQGADYKKKLDSTPVVIGLILIGLLIAGGIGYGVYGALFKPSDNERAAEAFDGDAVEGGVEVDLSEVDINAAKDSRCSLQGKIKKADNGAYVLGWSEGLTIYGVDEMGEKVLAQDVTNVFLDDAWLEEGLLESTAANVNVTVSGDIYIRGNSIYLEADEIINENGEKMTVKKKDTQPSAGSSLPAGIYADYIIPDSSRRLLGNGDVAGLALQEINYAKNEIYARHGRRFKSNELQSYFDSKSWYKGTIDPDNFSSSLLSDVEQKNAAFLSDVEFGMAPNGYQLDQ